LGASAAGFAYFALNAGWGGLGLALVGALVGLLAYVPLFALGWIGGGDAKLLMALGAWGGPRYAINVALLSIGVGAVLGILQLLVTGRLPGFVRRFWSFLRSWTFRELEPLSFRGDKSLTLPYAVPMAVAAVGRSLDRLPEVVTWFR
jgi:prepilin peptidase CpaA